MSKEAISLVAELIGEDPVVFISDFVEKVEGSEEETIKGDYKELLKAKFEERLNSVHDKGKKDALADVLTAEDYLAGIVKNIDKLADAPKLDRKSLSDAIKKIETAAAKKAVDEVSAKFPNDTDLQKQYNELLSENGKVTTEAQELKALINTIKAEKEAAVESAKKEVRDEFNSLLAANKNKEKVTNYLQEIINENVAVTNVNSHKKYSSVAISEFMDMYDLVYEGDSVVAYQKGTNKLVEQSHRAIDVSKAAKDFFLRDDYGFVAKEKGGITPSASDGNNASTKKTYSFPSDFDKSNEALIKLMSEPSKDWEKISALQSHISKL